MNQPIQLILIILSVTIIQVINIVSCHKREETILESPKLTNFGSWYNSEYCPPGSYATSAKLLVHPYQGGISSVVNLAGTNLGFTVPYKEKKLLDDSGLNGIMLYCKELKAGGQIVKFISSAYGQKGEWTPNYFTSCKHYAIGFELKSQDYQGENEDDSGATNFRLLCAGEDHKYFVSADEPGTWTGEQYCPVNSAVCGIQTQVDHYNKVDNTGLNNVRLTCCPLPKTEEETQQDDEEGIPYECTPREFLEKVFEFDNTDGLFPKTFSQARQVGINLGNDFKHGHDKQHTGTISSSSDTNLKPALGPNQGTRVQVSQGIKNELQGKGSYGEDWKTSSSDTWSTQKSNEVSITVPKGYATEVYQLVGHCGTIEIRSDKFIPVDITDKKKKKKRKKGKTSSSTKGRTEMATSASENETTSSMSSDLMMLGVMTLIPLFVMDAIMISMMLIDLVKSASDKYGSD